MNEDVIFGILIGIFFSLIFVNIILVLALIAQKLTKKPKKVKKIEFSELEDKKQLLIEEIEQLLEIKQKIPEVDDDDLLAFRKLFSQQDGGGTK